MKKVLASIGAVMLPVFSYAAGEAAITVTDATETITNQLTSVKAIAVAALVALAVIAGVRLVKRAF